MPGFTSVDMIADAVTNGRVHQQMYYKPTMFFPGAAVWFDGSASSGTPIYNPYLNTALVGTALSNSTNLGINTGPSLANEQSKYLLTAGLSMSGSGIPATAVLLDYLLFYPFVDCSELGQQDMIANDNLPRYRDGVGVFPIVVVQIPNIAGSFGKMTMNYLDTDENDQTVNVELIGSTTIGTMMQTTDIGKNAAAGSRSLFPRVADGTKGMKAIKNVTFATSMGGFCTIVLVKAIATIPVWEQATFSEKTYFQHTATLPEIKDGAFLNLSFIQASGGGAISPITGYFDFIWS
jgi:hypothetical protein